MALRVLLLQPYIGDFRARQIGVFTGSILIFLIVLACIRLIGARRVSQLLGIGCLWVVLTLLFEIGLGRFVMGYSWVRIASDYNILQGGFLSGGMMLLSFAPLIAAKIRGPVWFHLRENFKLVSCFRRLTFGIFAVRTLPLFNSAMSTWRLITFASRLWTRRFLRPG